MESCFILEIFWDFMVCLDIVVIVIGVFIRVLVCLWVVIIIFFRFCVWVGIDW